MSNMSYCRFQNTLTDLRDCFYAIQDEEELSKDEEAAKRSLIETCREIIALDEDQEEA